MFKRTQIFLLALFTYAGANAQELTLPQHSQYNADNPFLISPVYAGIGDHIKVRLNGLTQWVGIEDAPDTQTIAADARLGDRSGLGMFLYNDSNGYTKQRGARVSFAHHLTLDRYEDEFISLGISYNFNQFRIDTENFRMENGQLPTDDRATTNHNFDIGVLYRKDRFYLSVNAANILPKNLEKFNPTFEPNTLRNYYLYTGYKIGRAHV